MSVLSDIGAALTTAVTGSTPAQLQAQATAVEAQLQIAISTVVALQAIMVAELFLIMVMTWKNRH